MKHLNLIIGGIVLVLNVLIGLLISSYSTFNVCLTSGIIIISFALIELLKYTKLKDAFRISLTVVFAFFFIVNFILGIISPEKFQDNGYLIAVLIITVFEIIVLLACNAVSKRVK